MRPESTSVVLRPDLTELVQEYDAEKAARKFIGRGVAPIFKSAVKSAQYPIMNRENFKKPVNTKRAKGGAYPRITGEFGSGTFLCEDNGVEEPLDDTDALLYSSYFDYEAESSRMLWFQNLLSHEMRVASLIANAGFTNHNVTTAWSTAATAIPIQDIKAGIRTLEDNCGVDSSDISMIIPRADFSELTLTAQVADKTKYTYPGTQPAELSAEQIAAMFSLKKVLIAKGAYDSTEEGVAESMSQIWTAGVIYLAVCCDENDSLKTPSAARTILWTRDSDELPVIETYREEKVRSDIVRARHDTDEVLIGETDLFVYKLTNT